MILKKIDKLAQHIYEQTRDFNLDCQKKVPEMKIFDWQPWQTLDIGIKHEYQYWTHYLLNTGNFDYTTEQRHAFAVANRLAHGWRLGEERNDELKTDPFLIPMNRCPEWLFYWCHGKDLIMINNVLKFKKNEKV